MEAKSPGRIGLKPTSWTSSPALSRCGRWRAEAHAISLSSLGVAMRPQPVDLAAVVQPLVGFCLALEALDVACFRSGILGNDLPIILGDTVQFEGYFCFAHAALCRPAAGKSMTPAQDPAGD